MLDITVKVENEKKNAMKEYKQWVNEVKGRTVEE